jgi:hypothetical protein
MEPPLGKLLLEVLFVVQLAALDDHPYILTLMLLM